MLARAQENYSYLQMLQMIETQQMGKLYIMCIKYHGLQLIKTLDGPMMSHGLCQHW